MCDPDMNKSVAEPGFWGVYHCDFGPDCFFVQKVMKMIDTSLQYCFFLSAPLFPIHFEVAMMLLQ